LKQTELASELIEKTAKILRYSLSAKRTVNLKEELDIAETYLSLQKTRFGDKLNYKITSALSSNDRAIPPMIIQPLVENSLLHGMKGRDALMVSVSANETDNNIEISVYDNGQGFDLKAEAGTTEDRNSIGLKNIKQRLELEYHSDKLLSIESQPGQWSRVTIRIPLSAGAAL
jgi:two-component system sensor histidine kinase YesM